MAFQIVGISFLFPLLEVVHFARDIIAVTAADCFLISSSFPVLDMDEG